ncbi:hypothetical protein DV738_g3495, partial [Chaetothyriales sp. CBS 135597]
MATKNAETSTLPRVRDACEECHSRKIKCHATIAGACRACQNNGRLCFFLPRNKSGRPKVGEDGNKDQKQQADHAAGSTVAAAAAALAEHAAMVEASTPMSRQRAGTGSNSTPSPRTSARPIVPHPENMMSPHGLARSMSDHTGMGFAVFENMDWPNPLFQEPMSHSLDMDLDPPFPFQDPSNTEGYFDFHRPSLNMSSQHSDSGSYPSLEGTGGLPSIPSSEFDFNKPVPAPFFLPPLSAMPPSTMLALGESKGPDARFSTLLGHINRLQRCLEKVRSGKLFSYPHTRNNQLKLVISTIDTSCMATCSTLKDQFQAVLGQRSEAKANGSGVDFRPAVTIRPDQSLIALAITTILTIARLCQELMRSELPDAQSSLDSMLLLNRLGCNILQTRIALANIEKLDRGLAYLTEDALREISIVQTEFGNIKKNIWNGNTTF